MILFLILIIGVAVGVILLALCSWSSLLHGSSLASIVGMFVGVIIIVLCALKGIELKTEQYLIDNNVSKTLVEEIYKRADGPISKYDISNVLIKASKIELNQVDAIRMCDPSISVKMAEDILEQSRAKENIDSRRNHIPL